MPLPAKVTNPTHIPEETAEEQPRGLRDTGMVIAMAFRFYQPVWPVQRREVLENANYSQSYQVATTSIAAVPDMVSSQRQINTVFIKLTSAFYRSLPNTDPQKLFSLNSPEHTFPIIAQGYTNSPAAFHYLVHRDLEHLNTLQVHY